MPTILTQIQDRLRKRAAYRRTVNELRSMPLDTAIDLDFWHEDAERVARRAVYGY